MSPICVMWSSAVFEKMITSSRLTNAYFPSTFLNILFIVRWKVGGAFVSPNAILFAVLCLSFFRIGICQKPLIKNFIKYHQKYFAPFKSSFISATLGMGNLSCINLAFKNWKSMQNLTEPSFFRTINIWELYGLSLSSIAPFFNIISTCWSITESSTRAWRLGGTYTGGPIVLIQCSTPTAVPQSVADDFFFFFRDWVQLQTTSVVWS